MLTTIQLGRFIYAQGSVVERHENGEVTIIAYDKAYRGIPISGTTRPRDPEATLEVA